MVGIKGKCGGKREGAGRKRILFGKGYHYKADIDLVNVIDSQPNKNRFINDAVREKAEKEKLM